MLKTTLNEILCAVKPLTKDVETRMRIIDELRHVVSSIESLKGASVEPFGSFLSQLFSRSGDLDISIELPNGSHILVPTKQHKRMLLERVLKASRRTGTFSRLEFVSHARIPILKLESKSENIKCDISINNLSGHMKSKFLLWISLVDYRFRDMVLLVKEWAKANGINNPRDSTLNSYSLTLLVIFHFQTCVPPILPPLKDLYPGNMEDELTGVRADMERHIEEKAVSNIAKFSKEREVNHSSLPELFISFHGKFSEINTRATEQGICTFGGRWETINTNTRWLSRPYALFIEDPFEQPVNTARTVSHSQLTRIGEAFRNTYSLLIDPYQTRNTIIPFLVRHEIFRYLSGAPFVFPRADYGSYHNHGASHGYNPSSPSQNCFQEMGQYGEPLTLGPGLTVNPPLPRDRPRMQHQNAVDQKPAQQRLWHRRGHAQPVRPPWSHTLNPNNIVASQWAFKASPAEEAQQVWWQKQVDQYN